MLVGVFCKSIISCVYTTIISGILELETMCLGESKDTIFRQQLPIMFVRFTIINVMYFELNECKRPSEITERDILSNISFILQMKPIIICHIYAGQELIEKPGILNE